MPLMVKKTVRPKVVSCTRETVKVPGFGPTSEAAGSVAASVTTGVGLSAMVTVAAVFPYTTLFRSGATVNATVSGPSALGSLIGVTTRVMEATPAGITTLVGRNW